MNTRKSTLIAMIICIAGPILLSYGNSISSETKSDTSSEISGVRLGALLYDNWPAMKGVKLEGNNPLYPATAKKKGVVTYRCKECHGWDYIGKDGRYSKGSHYTGIIGVMAPSSKDASAIKKALTDSKNKHDFSTYLSEKDIDALVTFIKEGLVDINTVLDAKNSIKGDATKGCSLYGEHCSECHGENGQIVDFKKKKDGIQGVGWVTRDNPQETIHKIRWGHPGAKMPSMLVDEKLTQKDTVDILAHSQTLAQ